MYSLALLAISAILPTLAVNPLCGAGSNRLGRVDHPRIRNVLEAANSRTGGVAIFGSCV